MENVLNTDIQAFVFLMKYDTAIKYCDFTLYPSYFGLIEIAILWIYGDNGVFWFCIIKQK